MAPPVNVAAVAAGFLVAFVGPVLYLTWLSAVEDAHSPAPEDAEATET